jgi:hypothetical protein
MDIVDDTSVANDSYSDRGSKMCLLAPCIKCNNCSLVIMKENEEETLRFLCLKNTATIKHGRKQKIK